MTTAATFPANGRRCTNTAAGWRDAINAWAWQLADAGHRMTWQVLSGTAYAGICLNCGAAAVTQAKDPWIGPFEGRPRLNSRFHPGTARPCRRTRNPLR